MNNESRLMFLTGILLAVATTWVFASSASAGKTFSMVGEWALNRGILVDIPINGGPVLCFDADNVLIPDATGTSSHGGCVGRGGVLQSLMAARIPWPRAAGDVVAGFRPKNGGIAAAAVITTTGTAGSFTIPPHAFSQPQNGLHTATVMLAPTVVQLQTTLGAIAPPNAAEAAAATSGGGAAAPYPIQQPAKFMKNAWSMDAGQASAALPPSQVRPAADFTFCPAVPGCIFGVPTPGPGGPFGGVGTPTGTTTGSAPGSADSVIRYKAGVNKFGGTMAMLLKGGGSTTIRAASLVVPPTTMTLNGANHGRTKLALIAHLTFMNELLPPFNPQVNGAGYKFTNSVMLGKAQFHLDYNTSNHPGATLNGTTGGGMITASGPTATTMGATFGSLPSDFNDNFGFPWTTGAVSIMGVELGPLGTAGTGTLTGRGGDNRDAAGNGSITLVAGGFAHRILSGQDFEALEVVTMVFNDGTATPSMGPAGLATVALLMALTAGFTLRKRFARQA